MKTTIEFSPSYTMLTAELSAGESIKAEPGAMVAQQDVTMKTGMGGGGGLFGGLKRMVGGESFFVNTFTAGAGGGWVSLSPPVPGDVLSHELSPGQNLFIQGGSFMACTENVQTDSQFQGMKGMFSGEKIFFLRAFAERGQGTVFYNCYGALKQVSIEPGKELVVDTGHVVAFTDDVRVLRRQGRRTRVAHWRRRRARPEVPGQRPHLDTVPHDVRPRKPNHPVPAVAQGIADSVPLPVAD